MENDDVYKSKYLDPYDALYIEKGDTTGLNNPTLMYNTLINPFINLSIKGYIWYQGENNAGDRSAYTRLNELMIKCWRDKFDQGDLPFYLVQMTPHTWGGTNLLNEGYAYFREAQEKILETPNTGMAVTMDVGEFNQIHPSNKKPVGQRLAAWALAKTYQKNVQYKGPWYKNMEIVNDTIVINYDTESLGAGMITSNDSMPKHFFVCALDKKFYPAYAAIVGNNVKLFSPNVISPIAARYAFNTYAITNLQNIDGFPAVPFRTDTWEYNSGQIYMTNELDESQNPFNNEISSGTSKIIMDKLEFNIVPNPTKSTIELKCLNQKIENVQIFDVNGTMCFNRPYNGSLIDINFLSEGLYLLSATMQDKTSITNVFIKK
jgi:sialate O-acetylesterase